MKILLINVSRRWGGRVYREYPLGLGMLGTVIQADGHQVRLHDMAVDERQVVEIVEDFRPDVTGLSFLSTSSRTATALIKELKQINCGHLITGGIHSSLFPERMLRDGTDVVVCGEGEGTIVPLLRRLQNLTPGGFFNKSMLVDIHGIAFRTRDGEVILTPPADSVDLCTLPMVNRRLYDMSRYKYHSMISSRGCVYGCKFCCAWGPGGLKGRFLAPERILDEMSLLVRNFGPLELYWADDMFFFHHRDRMRFLSMLKERKLPVRWYVQLRPDSINKELLTALKESGCVKIGLGAEAGSDKILRTIGKGTTRKRLIEGISAAKDAGLQVKTWWILGLPGGGYNDQKESLDAIHESRPNEVALHSFVPLPGSEFWHSASRYGIELPVLDSLEDLFYYSVPGKVKLRYLSSNDLSELLIFFDRKLRDIGYVDTDHAETDSPYVFTSPLQSSTFRV